MKKLFKNKEGFTLIELIVIMAVLAIFVSMGAPKFLGFTKDANVTAMQTDAKIIEQAAMQYSLRNNDEFPLEAEGDAEPVALTDVDAEVVAYITGSTSIADKDLFAIDEDGVNEYIRTLKGELTDYAITKNGEVFSRKTVVNGVGDMFSGLELVKAAEAEVVGD